LKQGPPSTASTQAAPIQRNQGPSEVLTPLNVPHPQK
jgi:hypothetical protein